MVAIAELGHAPGKSMRAGQGTEALHIDKRGLFGDREYMWVEAGSHVNVNYKPGREAVPGQFLSQREDPVLTGVVPVLLPDGVLLSFGGQDQLRVHRREDVAAHRIPVSVWGWRGEGVDQGDEAAKWGEEILERPVRLVAISEASPRYVDNNPTLGRVGFCDGYPVTVGTTTTFRRLNHYLASVGRPAVPTNRVRATIILDGLELGDERCFPEDYVSSITVRSGDLSLVLERYKACGRCPIPDTDQVTGERKTYVRSALGKLGRTGRHADSETFGTEPELFLTQNFILHLPEDMPDGVVITVARGAEVAVTLTDFTNWVPS